MNKQSKQWLAIVVLAVCIGALGGMMIKQRHESKALYDAFRSLNTSAGQEKTVPIKMETNQWKTVADSLQWRLSDLEALVCLIKSHDDQVIYCSLKVGDSIKGMTVVAGQTGTHFKGRKTVTGTYDLRPVTGDSLVDWVCMVLDSASV
ncbi:MAG: hypothetical protein Q8R07_02535, partial [Candidatus Uhrbacteria bacterium]|nr:hypothetical protein [Candidatus Uhrbacteria bacterium]